MTRASSQTKGRVLTFEEYMALPEIEGRHEVIDGVIVMSPTPLVNHQLILLNLIALIWPYVRRRRLGTVIPAPCDLLIRKTPKLRVRQPDLMFFSHRRISREELKRAQIVEVTPDIAVEIRSPGNRGKRWGEKLADYASIELPEFWLINPRDQSVEVHALVEGRYSLEGCFENDDELHSRFLPGLAVPVSALFE